jgi:protein-disulfide isomerase
MTKWMPYVAVALVSIVGTSVVTTAVVGRAGAGSGEGVRAYLLAHPEVIPEAMERLRAKQMVAQIGDRRRAIETPFAGAWIGAAKPDVTLVQFFDYACGFCRASLPDINRLVREDPKIRVVFRELPILSADSEKAARISLAAASQNRFARFHDAMYAAGRPNVQTIAAAARAAALDPAAMQKVSSSPEAEQEIVRNLEMARALGFTGTPSWVVGDQLLSGAVGYEALKRAVAEARARRKA